MAGYEVLHCKKIKQPAEHIGFGLGKNFKARHAVSVTYRPGIVTQWGRVEGFNMRHARSPGKRTVAVTADERKFYMLQQKFLIEDMLYQAEKDLFM
jgi:hypothetical protein